MLDLWQKLWKRTAERLFRISRVQQALLFLRRVSAVRGSSRLTRCLSIIERRKLALELELGTPLPLFSPSSARSYMIVRVILFLSFLFNEECRLLKKNVNTCMPDVPRALIKHAPIIKKQRGNHLATLRSFSLDGATVHPHSPR